MHPFSTFVNDHLKALYSRPEINHISRLLLEKVAGLDGLSFYADKDTEIPEITSIKLREAVKRLERHEPLQYVLGETEFSGLVFQVGPGVLIPRPETEELVDLILKDFSQTTVSKKLQVVDVCTGSGCIAVSLAKKWPESQVEGWDISKEALEMAEKNASSNAVKVRFRQLDLLRFEPSDSIEETIDLIVSNPPYVCQSERHSMEPKVLDFEPHLALFVEDADPLVFYRKIGHLAIRLLKKGGLLYVEINSHLGKETVQTLEACSFSEISLLRDINGRDRYIRARR